MSDLAENPAHDVTLRLHGLRQAVAELENAARQAANGASPRLRGALEVLSLTL